MVAPHERNVEAADSNWRREFVRMAGGPPLPWVTGVLDSAQPRNHTAHVHAGVQEEAREQKRSMVAPQERNVETADSNLRREFVQMASGPPLPWVTGILDCAQPRNHKAHAHTGVLEEVREHRRSFQEVRQRLSALEGAMKQQRSFMEEHCATTNTMFSEVTRQFQLLQMAMLEDRSAVTTMHCEIGRVSARVRETSSELDYHEDELARIRQNLETFAHAVQTKQSEAAPANKVSEGAPEVCAVDAERLEVDVASKLDRDISTSSSDRTDSPENALHLEDIGFVRPSADLTPGEPCPGGASNETVPEPNIPGSISSSRRTARQTASDHVPGGKLTTTPSQSVRTTSLVVKSERDLMAIAKLHGSVRRNSVSSNEESSRRAEELSHEYQLKENLWDACLILWVPCFGITAHATLMFGLILNLMMQGFFCAIVGFILYDSNSTFTTQLIEDFSSWDHDADAATKARVCSLDHSLSSDYMQLTILGEAKVYIPEDGFIWGPCLCLAVLAAWGFHNCILVREVFEFLAAVSALHVRDSEMMCLETCGRTFSLHDIPTHRVVWAWMLGIMQLTIALVLLVGGSKWLISTTNISDLVLNAVALTYIMDIDEMIYAAIVPRDVRFVMRNLEPMIIKHTRLPNCAPRAPHGFFRSCLSITSIMVYVIFQGCLDLWPMVRNVYRIKDILCGDEVVHE